MTAGKSCELTRSVTEGMTAAALGSGSLPVFGTPCLIALMEEAACACLAGELPEGRTSVGVKLDVSHVSPTPVGMAVTARAEITGVSANGKLIDFRVTAHDEAGLIGEGTHQRAVVAADRFLEKCRAKRG